jgi:hypothetical protein
MNSIAPARSRTFRRESKCPLLAWADGGADSVEVSFEGGASWTRAALGGGGQVRGRDERAEARHVDRLGDDEANVAVDAASGIPPAAREPILDLHRDQVGPAVGADDAGEVEGEAGVAVGMGPDELAVHVDLGVHVHAVELDRDPPAGRSSRQLELLAVEAESSLEESGAGAGARSGTRIELDAPVVGQVEPAPSRVVMLRQVRVRERGRDLDAVRVREREPPALGEVDDLAAAMPVVGRYRHGPDEDDGGGDEQEVANTAASSGHDGLPWSGPSERRQARKRTCRVK